MTTPTLASATSFFYWGLDILFICYVQNKINVQWNRSSYSCKSDTNLFQCYRNSEILHHSRGRFLSHRRKFFEPLDIHSGQSTEYMVDIGIVLQQISTLQKFFHETQNLLSQPMHRSIQLKMFNNTKFKSKKTYLKIQTIYPNYQYYIYRST